MNKYLTEYNKRLHSITPYDINILKQCKEQLDKVYAYYYGDSVNRNFDKRLETISNKLGQAIELAEKS